MANKDFWTPQLESKLHCWHRLQTLPDHHKPAPCLTIAREYGCQAYPLAEQLAEELNRDETNLPWIIVGNQLLSEVAELSGYSIDQIERAKATPSSVKAIFSMFLDRQLAEETEIFQHLKPVIRAYAKRGHCIFIGQGAVLATQDLSNCTHVRLVAPHEFRVQRIMEAHNLNAEEAETYIEMHQQQREDFFRRFTDNDLNDPQLYHLVLNNSKMPISSMVELTRSYLH